MNALTTLAERCESAGADEQRELLEEAWGACSQSSITFRRFAYVAVFKDGLTNAGRFVTLIDAHAYVDAALMFVPEDIVVKSKKKTGSSSWAYIDPHMCYAATPAIAILSASLRAWADRSE